jgi:hypothetical protein
MLRIDRDKETLTPLEERRLREVGLQERYDIQQMIRQSPEEFFQEMGEELLLIGEEIRPAEFVEDRIDLLAIDKQGASVIIELKRGSNKLHLLQALAYASMVAKWDSGRISQEYSQTSNLPIEDGEEKIEEFLNEDSANLNESQRIILIAEGFEYQVLMTADWLAEQYEVDIRCYRIGISADAATEYLTCTCIYPPPEITAHAVPRGGRGPGKPNKWGNWEQALDTITNPAIKAFFQEELAAGRENYLRKRILRYRLGGKRRFNVSAKSKAAYVWQSGRFDGDTEFWESKIGRHAKIEPVKKERCLRFYLATAEDCKRFRDAVLVHPNEITFLDNAESPATEDMT